MIHGTCGRSTKILSLAREAYRDLLQSVHQGREPAVRRVTQLTFVSAPPGPEFRGSLLSPPSQDCIVESTHGDLQNIFILQSLEETGDPFKQVKRIRERERKKKEKKKEGSLLGGQTICLCTSMSLKRRTSMRSSSSP